MNLPDQTLIRKAYSAAYAGFRTAQTIGNAGLREAVERHSLDLLLGALEPKEDGIIRQITNLEYIVGFGRDVGDIHPHTAELLLAELSKMPRNPAMAESGNANNPAMLSKEDLFPVTAWDAPTEKRPQAPIEKKSISNTIQLPPKISNGSDPDEALARKARILAKIRQSGNCRMKDIQEVVPMISERTLRYDLQRMVQEDIIERVGLSGPSTYYRIKATSEVSSK